MTTVVETLPHHRSDDAVSVLCEAFYDYPVMRHVIGGAGDDYDRRLHTLIGFFVAARVLRKEPMIAVHDGDDLIGVAIMTPPGNREAPPEFGELRERVWDQLGQEARERYEHLGRVWQQFAIETPHLHLNMIGVLRSYAGRGVGRLLMDAVHDRSQADPGSAGVSLSTEDPGNVPLYSYFGYEIVGHQRVAPDIETWGFYRPNPA